jgi:hypothetical protein
MDQLAYAADGSLKGRSPDRFALSVILKLLRF